MKLSDALSFDKSVLMEMLFNPEQGTVEEYMEGIRKGLLEHVSPLLKEHLDSLQLNKVYAAMTTQQEVEAYPIEYLSPNFKEKLAEHIDGLELNPYQAMFLYDIFLGQYIQSAQYHTHEIAKARLRNILSKPKIIT